MGVGDAWEDEGYAGEDDWGEESIDADLEEELLEPADDGELEKDHAGPEPAGVRPHGV